MATIQEEVKSLDMNQKDFGTKLNDLIDRHNMMVDLNMKNECRALAEALDFKITNANLVINVPTSAN